MVSKKTKKRKIRMLPLEKDDPEKELEFEIEFQLSLTERQRYQRMKELVQRAIKNRRKHDSKATPSIISRS